MAYSSPAGAGAAAGAADILHLTKDTFETEVTKGTVLVDFWADWCGPCKAFAPTFEAAAGEHTDITFAKVDTDAEPELSGALNISSIPTVMAFRDGILVFAQPGALNATQLDAVIKAVGDLDMEQVRADLDKQQSGEQDTTEPDKTEQ